MLAKNPYNDLLSYKSTTDGQFIKDKDNATVNRYQKPLGLYLQLLKMFAAPGALVLDATCGTGSLELASMEVDAPSNLEFISFEKNLYQATNCVARLERSCTKPTSELDVMVDAKSESLGGVISKKKENKDTAK